MNTLSPITKDLYDKMLGEGKKDREVILTIPELIKYTNSIGSNSPKFDLTEVCGVIYFLAKLPQISIPIAIFNGGVSSLNTNSYYSGIYLERKYKGYEKELRELISDFRNFTLGNWRVIKVSEKSKKYRANIPHRISPLIYVHGASLWVSLTLSDGDYELVNDDFPGETVTFSVLSEKIVFDEMVPVPVDIEKVVSKLKFIMAVLDYSPVVTTMIKY